MSPITGLWEQQHPCWIKLSWWASCTKTWHNYQSFCVHSHCHCGSSRETTRVTDVDPAAPSVYFVSYADDGFFLIQFSTVSESGASWNWTVGGICSAWLLSFYSDMTCCLFKQHIVEKIYPVTAHSRSHHWGNSSELQASWSRKTPQNIFALHHHVWIMLFGGKI